MKKATLFLVLLIITAFRTGNEKCGFNIPRAAYSITTGDIDLDGDMDIVVGHIYSSQTDWTGITVLQNVNKSGFMIDSFYFNGQHRELWLVQLDTTPGLDFITQAWNNENSQLGVIFNNRFDSSHISLVEISEYSEYISSGDINNDLHNDIVIASHQGKFWGILYNDGMGGFREPEYHDVSYYPLSVACGDLNGDGRDDIVIAGQNTEVYFSYESGFELLTLEANNSKVDVKIVDLNKDGKKDIATYTSLYPYNYSLIKLYENHGNNNLEVADSLVFEPVGQSAFEVADFNNDTLPDFLFYPLNNEGLQLFYNQNDFTLSDPELIPMADYGEVLRRSTCADFDGNGYQDIATIRYLHATMPANLQIVYNDGQGHFTDSSLAGTAEEPLKEPAGLSCYPNPFREAITLEYKLQIEARINVSVYTLSGKLIKVLISEKQKGGIHKVQWNGTDNYGHPCSPGIYIFHLKGNRTATKSIKFIKY
jgi:hypothetical protein